MVLESGNENPLFIVKSVGSKWIDSSWSAAKTSSSDDLISFAGPASFTSLVRVRMVGWPRRRGRLGYAGERKEMDAVASRMTVSKLCLSG